jgi:hypothetical protein
VRSILQGVHTLDLRECCKNPCCIHFAVEQYYGQSQKAAIITVWGGRKTN